MAVTPKVFYRGAGLATPSGAAYTVPASTTAVITNIVITNTTATAASGVISLINGTRNIMNPTVPANSTIYLDCKIAMSATENLWTPSNTSLSYHISGVEIA